MYSHLNNLKVTIPSFQHRLTTVGYASWYQLAGSLITVTSLTDGHSTSYNKLM